MCSIEDAWGGLFPRHKKMPMENYSKLEEFFTQREKPEPEPEPEHIEKFGCKNFVEHFNNCPECRKALKTELMEHLENKKKTTIETFTTSELPRKYKDILILIALGIFIIFVCDCLVRLGRFSK